MKMRVPPPSGRAVRGVRARENFDLFRASIGCGETVFVTEQNTDLVHAVVVGKPVSVSMSSLRGWWGRGWIQLAEAKGRFKKWTVCDGHAS